MSDRFPAYLSLDYAEGTDQGPGDYPSLEDKIGKAVEVTRTALEQYRRPAVMWTGGKDSTLVLYVVIQVAEEFGHDRPPVVFIDHFQHFPETVAFVERWADRLGLDLVVARNEGIACLDADPGEAIPVSSIGDRNRRELDRLDFEGDAFVLDADTLAGNHLLKTVALNDAIADHGFDGVFSGVRWDEQEARADETFFSPRHDSETWGFVVPDLVPGWPDDGYVPQDFDDLPDGVGVEDLPVSPKYFEGFRSLGTETGSGDAADRPAWLQDLVGTTERAGRAQDKEDLMGRLRDLGYM
jgi:phosphoadenosine phosphosulfate reductase